METRPRSTFQQFTNESLSTTPQPFTFCPHCAARLTIRLAGGKPRPACPACGFVQFMEPKVGVGVMVVEGGQILLVQRAMQPAIGQWSIPAGYLDYGEDPRQVAARESLEETGLVVEVGELVDVYFNPESLTQGGASLFVLYRARVIGGKLKAGDDAAAAAFFPPDHLPPLAFSSSYDAIRRMGIDD